MTRSVILLVIFFGFASNPGPESDRDEDENDD